MSVLHKSALYCLRFEVFFNSAAELHQHPVPTREASGAGCQPVGTVTPVTSSDFKQNRFKKIKENLCLKTYAYYRVQWNMTCCVVQYVNAQTLQPLLTGVNNTYYPLNKRKKGPLYEEGQMNWTCLMLLRPFKSQMQCWNWHDTKATKPWRNMAILRALGYWMPTSCLRD